MKLFITFQNILTILKIVSIYFNKLNGISLDDDHKLISLDVVFLFTNVPTDLIINSIVKQ